MSEAQSLPDPTWMVGCGNMGGAVVEGWRAAGFGLGALTVIRPSGTPVEGVRTVSDAAAAGAPPRVVILAMKPQMIDDVAPRLRPLLSAKTVLLSMLAGVEASSLRSRFPGVAAVVRVIPNLPVAVRRGVIGLFSPDANESARQQVADLFQPLGFAPWVADEAKIGAIGAVAGAGPAYVARFTAALAKAGEARGLSREMAEVVALETILGTGWLAAATRWDMATLARRVASPNGTTEAGLAVLDREQVLDALVDVAIAAAARRGAELAEDARAAPLAGSPTLP